MGVVSIPIRPLKTVVVVAEVGVQADSRLFQVAQADRLLRRLQGSLQRREEQRRQNGDDCHNDEQFNERKSEMGMSHGLTTFVKKGFRFLELMEVFPPYSQPFSDVVHNFSCVR